MEHSTIEQVPEGLGALYEGDFGSAPFTVDDIVAGGRRRRRRRTLAGVGGAAVAAVALAVAIGAGTGLIGGGQPTGAVSPAGPVTGPSTPAPVQPGCVDTPVSCLEVVGDWSREVASSSATVVAGDSTAYEAGTVVLHETVSSVPRQQDIHLSVVIAPTTLAAKGEEAGPVAPHEASLPGLTGRFERLTTVGGGNFVDRWQVPSSQGRPAVELSLNVANQGPAGGPFAETADDVAAPSWWSEATVARLVEALLGSDAVGAGSGPR